jgi:hypothetical protein
MTTANRDHPGTTVSRTNHTTYAKDGRVIMDTRAHVTYFIYSMICFFLFFLVQLPPEYAVEVDVERICQAITFKDDDGERKELPGWILGPGRRTALGSQEQALIRAEVGKRWAEHLRKQRSVLPVVQVKGALDMEKGVTTVDEFLEIESAGLKGE